MANFIVDFLEWNRKTHDRAKRIVIDQDNDHWVIKHLGFLPLTLTVLACTLLFIAAIVTYPIFLLKMIINAPYVFYLWIINQSLWRDWYIKRQILKYEKYLNSKPTYDLRTSPNSILIHVPNDLNEFLRHFFKEYNNKYITYQGSNIICKQNRRRSVEDIYLICKNYLPDVTLDDVLRNLVSLIDEDFLSTSKCSDINRYVFALKGPYAGLYVEKELDFMNGVNFKQLIEYYESC